MTIDTSKISKTTLIGVMLFVVCALRSVHFDAAGHLAMTARDWFTVATGALMAVVGKLQKDAN